MYYQMVWNPNMFCYSESSSMEYNALPENASVNSSTIGPTPELRIVTPFTCCSSWMNRSDPFFFRIVNHRFDYGASKGSRIYMPIFSFSSSMMFGIWDRGTGIGFKFHGTWSIVKITIGSITLASTHLISFSENAKAFPQSFSIFRKHICSYNSKSPSSPIRTSLQTPLWMYVEIHGLSEWGFFRNSLSCFLAMYR